MIDDLNAADKGAPLSDAAAKAVYLCHQIAVYKQHIATSNVVSEQTIIEYQSNVLALNKLLEGRNAGIQVTAPSSED